MKHSLHKEDLTFRFNEFIEKEKLFSKDNHMLVACSGGIDSIVLVNLLHELRFNFTVLHCNFQLRGDESQRDQDFVTALANHYGVKCVVKKFDTEETTKLWKKGVQETARLLRYNWFDEQIQLHSSSHQQPLLLTAHHLDDQLETVAFNFFRGTGIAGLTGMNAKDGHLIRPLLFASRDEIEAYAVSLKLSWVEDSSNKESTYARNTFRNEVFPTIEKIIPSFRQNLSNNIKRFQETEMLFKQQMASIKKRTLEQRGNGWALAINKIKHLTPLNTIVYEVFSAFGFAATQVDELKKLFDADTGSYLQSTTYRVLKNRAWLLIDPLHEISSKIYLIEKGQSLIAFGEAKLTVSTKDNAASISTASNEAWLDASKLEFPLLLRPWKNGDYFYPLGMKKKKKVSKFLIDQKLSKSDKEGQYVIESAKKIVWVVGRRIDDRFKIFPATKEVLRLKLN
ncbi:MAG: tRNA lysidine(34) synthetase TilS [Bacteroidota bacterium]